VLKRRGVLEPYSSPSAMDIPATMKDPEGAWTGFAARARVLLYNTNLMSQADPKVSVMSLADPAWKGKAAVAYPLFGTTATHAAVLSVILGDQPAREFFESLQRNEVLVLDGNASVRDAVVRGDAAIGWTDTDDAQGALARGAPVAMVFPDQAPDQSGALVIPNTVALIRNCPNPETGRRLIDFLLSREVEEMLAKSGSAQMPVRAGVPTPPEVHPIESIRAMEVDWERVADRLDPMAEHLGRLFVR
jgi:iron(III) transport system substrate-binding protein